MRGDYYDVVPILCTEALSFMATPRVPFLKNEYSEQCSMVFDSVQTVLRTPQRTITMVISVCTCKVTTVSCKCLFQGYCLNMVLPCDTSFQNLIRIWDPTLGFSKRIETDGVDAQNTDRSTRAEHVPPRMQTLDQLASLSIEKDT